MSDSLYNIKVESIPKSFISLDTDLHHPRLFNEFMMRDSIFDMYPICQYEIRDYTGLHTEKGLFTEGLEFQVQISSLTQGKIMIHNFYNVIHRLFDASLQGNHIGGTLRNIMRSHQQFQDRPKSRSFGVNNISAIVNQIFLSDYIVKGPRFNFVSPTGNTKNYYQDNVSNRVFFNRLCRRAISPNAPNSPFLCFINLANEFRFQTIQDLILQPPVEQLVISGDSADGVTAANVINSYEIHFTGATTNQENYQVEFYETLPVGIMSLTGIKPIAGQVQRTGKGKMLVRQSLAVGFSRKQLYYGVSDTLDIQDVLGWQNYQFLNSMLPYQMTIYVKWNPNFVSGKTVFLNIDSADKFTKIVSQEYSGLWLIMEAIHYWNGEDRIPWCKLVIGRNIMGVEQNHPFYLDFI